MSKVSNQGRWYTDVVKKEELTFIVCLLCARHYAVASNVIKTHCYHKFMKQIKRKKGEKSKCAKKDENDNGSFLVVQSMSCWWLSWTGF